MMKPPPHLVDQSTAVEFVKWCVEEVGLGYHPDTSFSDYVLEDGRPCFSATEASTLDELTDVAFKHCDPYKIGEHELRGLLARSSVAVPD